MKAHPRGVGVHLGAIWLVLFVVITGAVRGLETPSGPVLRANAIDGAVAYSQSAGGHALIVRQWGRTLHESYADGSGPMHRHRVFSITKSLAAMACFAAAGDGWLSLDEHVADTITEWKSHPVKRKITVRMLLDQTAGIAAGFPGLYAPKLNDKSAAAIRLPVVFTPGAQFDYGPSYFEVLETLLSRKLKPRDMTTRQWIVSSVLSPAGATVGADWRSDRSGHDYLSTGAMMTASDLAALAGVILARGKIGFQTVFPSRYLVDAAQGSSANRMYGLSFWNNANASRPSAREVSIEETLGREYAPAFWQEACLSTAAPDDLLAMLGSGGVRVYIVPSRGLVVVRVGNGGNFNDSIFLARLFNAKR
ncbi:MAG: serine hydrolase domain-containing protein [Chthoniobacterales bacterium]